MNTLQHLENKTIGELRKDTEAFINFPQHSSNSYSAVYCKNESVEDLILK